MTHVGFHNTPPQKTTVKEKSDYYTLYQTTDILQRNQVLNRNLFLLSHEIEF